MDYLPLKDIPEGMLPIYFCDAYITIQQTKRNKKTTYINEMNKVVLKGCNEDELISSLRKKNKKGFLTKNELKNSKVIKIEIKLLDSLSFGIKE